MTEKKTWHHYYCKECGDTYESLCEHKEVEIRAGERKQTYEEVRKAYETKESFFEWLEQKIKAME